MKLHMQILIALGLGIKRNWHIFFGIILGILLGIFLHGREYPMVSSVLTFIGQVFIRLIQMVVIPLVVSAIIIGITSIGDNKQLGKFGSKMILYYGIITVIAVTIGAVLALVVQPGLGAAHYINQNTAVEVQASVATAMTQQQGNILNIFLGFIP
ncbi:cation:dicarboxylase symporter family transporter, partial [bacterium]|nr:cation:dicarboxylase symporter family transporter [bacterium]